MWILFVIVYTITSRDYLEGEQVVLTWYVNDSLHLRITMRSVFLVVVLIGQVSENGQRSEYFWIRPSDKSLQ
jgi:hypothetical protein